MLLQALALLTLGALCSSVPVRTPGPSTMAQLSQDLCSSTSSIEYVILEVLVDIKTLAVQESVTVPVNVTVKRCIRNHLRTFSDSLTGVNRTIANRLAKIHDCEKLFPQGSKEECETAETVGEKVFREKIEKFLRFLYEEL